MKLGPLVAGLIMLVLAASFALLLKETSFAKYEQKTRAISVEGRVVAAPERSYRTRKDGRDTTHVVQDLDVRATFQGREVRRTMTEGVNYSRRNRIGETRRFKLDPQNPDVPLSVWPAFVFLLPGFFAAGLLVGGLLLVVGARRRVEG